MELALASSFFSGPSVTQNISTCYGRHGEGAHFEVLKTLYPSCRDAGVTAFFPIVYLHCGPAPVLGLLVDDFTKTVVIGLCSLVLPLRIVR